MTALLAIGNPVLPVSYELSLDIIPSKTNFKGFSRIGLRQTGDSFETFELHCKDIVILSACLKGSGIDQDLKIQYDKEAQTCSFTSPNKLSLGEGGILELTYIGRINAIKTHRDTTAGVFQTNFMDERTGTSDNYLLATHCQPTYARAIFPCLDEPSVKATFQVQIKTSEKFKVVSNAAHLSSESLENDLKLVKFKTTPPMVTSLFGFAVGDLDFITTEATSTISNKPIPINVYSPWDIVNAAFALDTIQKYLPLVEKFFGKPYPLDKLDFVLLPFLTDMAMENFGMITIQTGHLLIPPSVLADLETRQQVMQLIVHELVHQWMGNYISFDSWEHLWFNEAFATWCACYVLEKHGDLPNYWTSQAYLLQQTEEALLKDAHVQTPSIFKASQKALGATETQNLFDPHSYAKGIVLLRSMQLCVGENYFNSSLQKIFQDSSFTERSIKPIDIFVKMGQLLNSENVARYFSSWCRTPGAPIVSVTMTEDTTTLVQSRLLDEEAEIEDVPYYVPLFIKLANGELDTSNVLLTDRSLSLDYSIALCNHDGQGYYRVSYESKACYNRMNMLLSTGGLSEMDLVKIFVDLSHYIGDFKYQRHVHLAGLCQLLRHLAGNKVDLQKYPKYWRGLSQGLEILQTIQMAIGTYGTPAKQFAKYHDTIVKPLVKKISWPQGVFSENYRHYEVKVMSQVMFLAQEMPEVCSLCKKYFKHILQGPTHSIPVEIVGSTLAVVSRNSTSVKQYKSVLELVKSCKGIVHHISSLEGSADKMAVTLQNFAITNMGFSIDAVLINKLLNFVDTNIDSTSIELALFGLAYNAKLHPKGVADSNIQIRDVVRDWFNRHFDAWAHKSLKPGYASAERMKKSLSNISLVVFQMFVDSPEQVDAFALMKQSKFGKELGVYELWQLVKHNEMSKMKIYQDILGF